MKSRTPHLGLAMGALCALAACSQTEPSEYQMKAALQAMIDHHIEFPGVAGMRIRSVTKGACEKPAKAGVHCAFTLKVDGPDAQFAVLLETMKDATFKFENGTWAVVE